MVRGQKPKQTGRVVSVTQTPNGMVKCSVQLSHSGGAREDIPVGKPHSGVMWKPKPGWTVVVDYTDDGNPFVCDVLSVSSEYNVPDLAEGAMTFQFDGETEITVNKDNSGNYTVDISASGEVTVDSDTVKLGGKTGTKVVARKGDTVETNDPLTGTNTGQITGGASNTEAK